MQGPLCGPPCGDLQARAAAVHRRDGESGVIILRPIASPCLRARHRLCVWCWGAAERESRQRKQAMRGLLLLGALSSLGACCSGSMSSGWSIEIAAPAISAVGSPRFQRRSSTGGCALAACDRRGRDQAIVNRAAQTSARLPLRAPLTLPPLPSEWGQAAPHALTPLPPPRAALLAVAAQAVHLDFDKGLDGVWEHSEESKWVGRFVTDVPASLEKKALKVRWRWGCSVRKCCSCLPATAPRCCTANRLRSLTHAHARRATGRAEHGWASVAWEALATQSACSSTCCFCCKPVLPSTTELWAGTESRTHCRPLYRQLLSCPYYCLLPRLCRFLRRPSTMASLRCSRSRLTPPRTWCSRWVLPGGTPVGAGVG